MAVTEHERALSALLVIPPDVDRTMWLKALTTARHAGVSEDECCQWSANATDKFNENDFRSTWRSIGMGSVSEGWLFKTAKESYHWQDPARTNGDGQHHPGYGANNFAHLKPAQPTTRKRTPAEVWASGTQGPQRDAHPYLRARGISGAGLRLVGNGKSAKFAVPFRDAEGKIQTLQLIDANGEKRNLAGAHFGSSFFVPAVTDCTPEPPLVELPEDVRFLVCEGIGQAAALWRVDAYAVPVVTAGLARFQAVAQALRERLPRASILLVPDAGGEASAQKIAHAVRGSWLAWPAGTPANTGVDDYARAHGDDALADLLRDAAHDSDDATQQLLEEPSPETASPVPLKATHANDIGPDMKPPPQVVEDMICEGEVCVWFGPSQAGKTTLMAQLCISVALGIDFLGKRTRQDAVVYVAAEVPGNVMRRIQGAKQHFGFGHMPLTVIGESIDLFDGLADVARLVEFVRQFAAESGERVKLIAIDTLARSCGDGDENSTRDMGMVMRNLTSVANATGAAVVVVHHTGIADTGRSRGSSVIYSNADGEVVCEHDKPQDVRLLSVKKQRNLGTDGMKLAARFVRVEIGTDEWGKPLTASAVEAVDVPEGMTMVGKRMGEVEGAVIEFLAAHKIGIRKSAVVKHFAGRYEKGPVYRAMKTLHTAHAIHEAAGMVVIADAAK